MSPHDAFLQDIRENPDDDAVRLIYADWLSEQDDPRGEFIRIQVQMERMKTSDARWPAMNQRQRDLLQDHQEEWARGLRGLVRRFAFRRGFPHQVVLTVQEFVDRGDDLLRVAPLVEVHLLKAARQLRLLADCAALRQLRSLSLSYSHLNDAAMEVLSELPRLAGLRVLLLDRNFIRGPGAVMLAHSPHLSRLQRLDLRGNQLTAIARQALLDRFGAAVRL